MTSALDRELDLQVLDHVPSGCCAIAEDGTVVFWNSVLEQWTGIARRDVLGCSLFERFPQLDRRRFRARILAVMQTGAPALFSALLTPPFFPRPDASLRRSFENTVVTRLDRGTRALITVTDVTEQFVRGERYREAQKRAAEETEKRSIRERELHEAKAVAVAATEAKSSFLAAMSHELRTPMNGVLGMCQLLLGAELGPTERERVEIIHASGLSLLTVLNDILDFSKIEAERLELESVPFDPRQMVEDSMCLLAEMAQSKGLEWAFVVTDNVPAIVRGDPMRFRQVITNLLSNAVKFTNEGRVVLRLMCIPAGPSEHLLACEVLDTGEGMSQETCSRLFQPFVQGDASTTRKFGGTGLGLSISTRLANLMGGHVTVESRPGQGSLFRFTARFGRVDEEPRALPAEGRRVLVALSQPAMQEGLVEQFRHLGANVEFAPTWSEARTRLIAVRRSNPFEVLIVDDPVARKISAERPLLGNTRVYLAGHLAALSQPALAPFTARIALPCRHANLIASLGLAEPPKPTPVETAPIAGGAPAARIRVLLAEDNVVNQKVACALLAKMNCDVVVAADGMAAVTAEREGTFDIVFMDVQMPQMDGYAATAAIRERVTDRTLPIVAMTANALQGDREACINAGMDDFISKPVSLDALKQALARWTATPAP